MILCSNGKIAITGDRVVYLIALLKQEENEFQNGKRANI